MCKKKTTEQFKEDAINLHGDRYDYSKSVYINAFTKVIIICKIHGDFLQTPANHLMGQNCPKCKITTIANKLKSNNEKIDNFLLENNIPLKRLDDYIKSNVIIQWQCLKCNNIWKTSPCSILNVRSECPICNDTKKDNNYIDNFLLENNIQIKRIDNYINSYTKINWQCLKCDNIWDAQPCEITRNAENRLGSGCPKCAKYKNEKIIGEVLNDLNIKTSKLIIKISNKKLFPDYYLPNLNTIIEYNGIQHYKPTCFGNMSIDDAKTSFDRQINRDNLLREYCKDNNIILLEIDGREYKYNKLRKFIINYFNERKGK